MPSWTEKPHVTPTINVDLAPSGATNPIPCHIPRAVAFYVALGECTCGGGLVTAHSPGCPARPVRVDCNISGETWATSDAFEASLPALCRVPTSDDIDAALVAARERWALVKALVMGKETAAQLNAHGLSLAKQRDSVFAALADMARAESTIIQRFADIDKAFTHRKRRPFCGPAADELAAFVEHLIEQVGVM
jgi:hypothetical protein